MCWLAAPKMFGRLTAQDYSSHMDTVNVDVKSATSTKHIATQDLIYTRIQ